MDMEMSNTTQQTKNRQAATIPVAVCRLCLASVPEDRIAAHLEWHNERKVDGQ
jgi:hypothetical protein